MKVMLTDVRLSHVHVFEARNFQGEGEKRFECSALFAPDSENAKKVRAAIEQEAKAKYGDEWQKVVAAMPEDRRGLRDGDLNNSDGYAGNLFVKGRNAVRPGVYDRDTSPLVAADGKPYSGCYGNMEVDIWAQKNQYGKGINVTLLGVQFTRDGDAFSAGAAPSKPDSFANLSAAADPLA